MKRGVSLTFAAILFILIAFLSFFYYLALPSPFSTEMNIVPRYLCNGFLVLDWFQTEIIEKNFALSERIPIFLWGVVCWVCIWGTGTVIWSLMNQLPNICRLSMTSRLFQGSGHFSQNEAKWNGFAENAEKATNDSVQNPQSPVEKFYAQKSASLFWGERTFFSLGIGLTFWSTLLFFLGFFGMSHQTGLFRVLTFLGVLTGIWNFRSLFRFPPFLIRKYRKLSNKEQILFAIFLFFLTILFIPFLLGGMLPPVDYDVLEYHAQGPREFFENGSIGFSPHNVYLNMPLGAEMLFLWGMNLTGTIFEGMLVGKTLISSLSFLTLFGIFLWTRRMANHLFLNSVILGSKTDVSLSKSRNNFTQKSAQLTSYAQKTSNRNKKNEIQSLSELDKRQPTQRSVFASFVTDAKSQKLRHKPTNENDQKYSDRTTKSDFESNFDLKTDFNGEYFENRRSLLSNIAAIFAAFFYLTLPDNFQVFTNGLNDGVLGLALLLSGYAFFLFCQKNHSQRFFQGSFQNQLSSLLFFLILTGIFCGFAISIKYTAFVFIWIPIFLGLGCCCYCSKQTVRGTFFVLLIFVVVSLTIGSGWLIKNVLAVQNPVYPLGYSIFGTSDEILWNTAKNLRWTTAHSSSSFSLTSMGNALYHYFYQDYFVSPFCAITLFLIVFVGFVYRIIHKKQNSLPKKSSPHFNQPFPDISQTEQSLNAESEISQRNLSLNVDKNSDSQPLPDADLSFGWKTYWGLVLYLIFFLLAWLFLTHRLTRFMVPVLPVLAILFGVGCGILFAITQKRLISILFVIFLTLGFHYSSVWEFILVSDCLTPYETIRNDPQRSHDWAIWFNQHPELFFKNNPKETIAHSGSIEEIVDRSMITNRLLLIYDAAAFAYSVPILYNTCWDETVLPLSFERRKQIQTEKDLSNVDRMSIFHDLHQQQIGFILVHYGEKKRFLSKGNYGVCNPELDEFFFQQLIQLGIIEPFRPSDYAKFSEYTRQNIEVYRVKYPNSF